MIHFEKFKLENGLTVIVHTDNSTPFAAFNILYNVGSKHENPNKTGFAHLFEHLMFSGSEHIKNFDTPLQLVGGENNAFTNYDITNYYITLPGQNIETAFWLESDRMFGLNINEKSLATQKSVVIEEFKQNFLNKPYGDAWMQLRDLAYTKHSYKWCTIGKDIEHIEKATLEDVKNFYKKHYAPNNAILCVTGNVDLNNIKELCDKWFKDIPALELEKVKIEPEPKQTSYRELTLEKDVPFDSIYMAFHMCKRTDDKYQTYDLISDILSNGDSSRLFQRLVKDQNLFQNIDAYITGDFDNGLFIITGKLLKEVNIKDAEAAIYKELNDISTICIDEYELNKVKNKIESNLVFSEIGYLNKAINLCLYEALDSAELINTEIEKYRKITAEDILSTSKQVFNKNNCSTIFYLSKNN